MTAPQDPPDAYAALKLDKNLRDWVRAILDSFLAPLNLSASKQGVDDMTQVIECRARELAVLRAREGREMAGWQHEQAARILTVLVNSASEDCRVSASALDVARAWRDRQAAPPADPSKGAQT